MIIFYFYQIEIEFGEQDDSYIYRLVQPPLPGTAEADEADHSTANQEEEKLESLMTPPNGFDSADSSRENSYNNLLLASGLANVIPKKTNDKIKGFFSLQFLLFILLN